MCWVGLGREHLGDRERRKSGSQPLPAELSKARNKLGLAGGAWAPVWVE